MRVNERQQQLTKSSPQDWLEICTTGCHAGKFIEDRLTDGTYRFIAKFDIPHGVWLIHSVHISNDLKTAWACISDNVAYIEKQAQDKINFELGLNKRKVLKPLLSLVSNWGQALFSFHTENKLTNTQFELLLMAYDLWNDVHMRTKGFIRDGLNWISTSQYSTTKGQKSSKMFILYEKLTNRIQTSNASLNDLFNAELKILSELSAISNN